MLTLNLNWIPNFRKLFRNFVEVSSFLYIFSCCPDSSGLFFMEWTLFGEKEPHFNEPLIVYRPRPGKYTVACLRKSELGDLIWFTQARYWMRAKETDYWMPLPKAPGHWRNRSNPIGSTLIQERGNIYSSDTSLRMYRKRNEFEKAYRKKYGDKMQSPPLDYIQLTMFE